MAVGDRSCTVPQVAYVKDGQAGIEDRFARWIEEPLKDGLVEPKPCCTVIGIYLIPTCFPSVIFQAIHEPITETLKSHP